MTENPERGRQLCSPRLRDNTWYRYGLVVLERDPTGPEACPLTAAGARGRKERRACGVWGRYAPAALPHYRGEGTSYWLDVPQ
jgi:hypothetical protein